MGAPLPHPVKDFCIAIRNRLLAALYKTVARRVFFFFDAERVHDRALRLGALLGRHALFRAAARAAFGYTHPALKQVVCGVRFPNPVGLAAGFDKNGLLPDVLPSVGFGFAEIGSITGEPCAGNAKPRLWRLKRSRGLLVNYGLANDGCERVATRLAASPHRIPLGASVAKTNSPATTETNAGIADYTKAFRVMEPVAEYLTVNISCPNAFGGEPFTDPGRLEKLLVALDTIQTKKPVFVKLSPDLSLEQLDHILAVLAKHRVHGIICTNLTKNRANEKLRDTNIPPIGGMSGKIVEELANASLQRVWRKTRGKYALVGCGGVFSAEDAYEKIKSGASLVQLITGMIFEGPQLISDINRGLVRLLKKDGFRNVSEAVGTAEK